MRSLKTQMNHSNSNIWLVVHHVISEDHNMKLSDHIQFTDPIMKINITNHIAVGMLGKAEHTGSLYNFMARMAYELVVF